MVGHRHVRADFVQHHLHQLVVRVPTLPVVVQINPQIRWWLTVVFLGLRLPNQAEYGVHVSLQQRVWAVKHNSVRIDLCPLLRFRQHRVVWDGKHARVIARRDRQNTNVPRLWQIVEIRRAASQAKMLAQQIMHVAWVALQHGQLAAGAVG